ncbi:MAG: hypothetical protein K1X89_12610 [Myxococcaceae bacterium]|nr:hypothetical protein [Myxococcaceae bacterium]
MAIERAARRQVTLPTSTKASETTSTAEVRPTTTPVAKAKSGIADAVAAPVIARPAARSQQVGGAAASSVSGDWLGGGQSGREMMTAALARHGLTGTSDAPPPAGANIHRAKLGTSALISPATSQLDPRASAADNIAKLKAEGIPRFPGLSAAERAHETAFASEVEADPQHFIEGAMILARNDKLDTSIFEVDAMKRQYGPYGQGAKPENADERALRGTMNHALHPTAVTVARLAFLAKLDELGKLPEGDPKRQVFVTNGGCAAGKGSLTDVVKQQLGDIPFGAVWDAAGEGDALENAWILEACQARGLKTVFGFVENNPMIKYQDVIARGDLTGRIVDVATFTNSYVEGAKNMRAFLESPAYLKAQADGTTRTFGVYTGRFDQASLDDSTKPPYPDLHLLGDGGVISAKDVPRPPSKTAVLAECIATTERALTDKRTKGEPTDVLLQGALQSAQKFIASWEDA